MLANKAAWNDGSDVSAAEGECELPISVPALAGTEEELTEAQKAEVADADRRLSMLRRMQQDAEDLKNPRLLNMLQALEKQTRRDSLGRTQSDAAMRGTLKRLRLDDDERARQRRRVRSVCASAHAEAATRVREEKNAKLGRTALRWRSCQRAKKAFDSADLGQGKKGGGTQAHFRNRRDLFARVAAKFTLDEAEVVNMDRTFKLIDEHRRRSLGPAYGSEFMKDMRKLCDQQKEGRQDALSRWVRLWQKRVPAAGIEV